MRIRVLAILLVHAVMLFVHAVGGVIQPGYKKGVVPAQSTFEVGSSSKKYSRIKSLFLHPALDKNESESSLSLPLIKIVMEDLDFTDQFDVERQHIEKGRANEKDFKEISSKKLFDNGISLLIFFMPCEKKTSKARSGGSFVHAGASSEIRVIVKDTNSDTTVFDKKMTLHRKNLVLHAHSLSSEILKSLTGDEGVCLSSLAYCKQSPSGGKDIYVSDYACRHNWALISSRRFGGKSNLAPRWHGNELFYSQLTGWNNRLMSYNVISKKNRVVTSFKGLNMQPAASPDMKKFIVCFSGGKGNSELYLYDEEACKSAGSRRYIKLTANGRHNVSPCMLPDGNIIFCSDFQTGQPQLFYMNLATKEATRLTDGRGYAASPSYCASTNMVVYSRLIKDRMQLFTFSMDGFEEGEIVEKQLTSGRGSKCEPCWSEDGRYIVFSVDVPQVIRYEGQKKVVRMKKVPQVAVMNYKSGKMRVLTKDPAPKSFPCWTSRMVWAG